MNKFKFILILTFCFLAAEQSFADGLVCPDYTFTRNLVQGMRGEDVRLLQKILNADKRTTIALKGVGSLSNESPTFGRATRESLKRFQALFIEYIGVANGKLNDKTLVSLNAVCKGPYFTGRGGSVYDLSTSTKDTLPPIVAMAGPSNFDIAIPFRAYIGATEAIKTPSLTGLIIAGATASDIRKISSTTYTFLVTPNSDVGSFITLQMEAESVQDLAGNKNPNASNEWDIYKVVGPLIVATDTPLIDLPTLLGSTTILGGTDCSKVASVSAYDYSNPCYGKVPMTADPSAGGSPSSDSGGGQSPIMQMLQGLLQGLAGSLLKGLGGGGGGQGGSGTAQATCACAIGKKNVYLSPKGGLGTPGFYDDTINPGIGNYIGTPAMGPQFCGYRMVKGQCQGPTLNTLGQPVIGTVPSAPLFMWGQ